MPTPTPFSSIQWRSFCLLLVTVTLLFAACQKETLQQTTIEGAPVEQQELNDVALRQLVLAQVFDIPAAKMEHPKMQQLATSFIDNLSSEEQRILPTKIQALQKAPLPTTASNRSAPTPQAIAATSSLQFGQSLAQQGDFLFVGDNGAVHIYHQSNGKYTEQQVITGNAEDGFGYKVAITRNWLAIGAPFENEIAGAIYIYAREQDHWVFSQKIAGEDMNLIGQRFAMHGNNLVAQKQFGISGNLQVYELEDSHWHLETTLGEGIFFWDIAMDGNRIAANGGTTIFDAAVHVFAEEDGKWTSEAVLSTPGTLLFRAVALQGKTIMANFLIPMDKSYVFTYQNDAWEADGEMEIPGTIPFTNTHWIALRGDLAVVTVADGDVNDAVHVYEKSFRKWRHVESVDIPDAIANGQSVGAAVLITNRGKVVLGAPGLGEFDCFCPPDSEAVFGLPGQVVVY